MFENLTETLTRALKKIRGQARITEQNIERTLEEVRQSLLEADVNYQVLKEFLGEVKQKALGTEVLASLNPAQQFIKIIYDELVEIMGERAEELNLKGTPATLMLVGLHGSGKTTTCAKLALRISSTGRKPLMVPVDVYRPAAIEQLMVLGQQIQIPVFSSSPDSTPEQICKDALEFAKIQGFDTMLIDTAGRLHIDEELLKELRELKSILAPCEVLLVADAMTGQDAVNIAERFNQEVGLTGIILTKLDGDARGGAALSIKRVTGKPIKLVGVGEKLDALEVFHPERMASRILDLGDIVSLAEKAEKAFEEKEALKLAKKIRKQEFTFEDFQMVLKQIRKMGPLEELMDMLPGMKAQKKLFAGFGTAEKELKKAEAIINSMTPKERRDFRIINGRRRIRIARGSGTTVQDVNRLLKSYLEMRKMMKKANQKNLFRLVGGL